jgi:hypothetical protein
MEGPDTNGLGNTLEGGGPGLAINPVIPRNATTRNLLSAGTEGKQISRFARNDKGRSLFGYLNGGDCQRLLLRHHQFAVFDFHPADAIRKLQPVVLLRKLFLKSFLYQGHGNI